MRYRKLNLVNILRGVSIFLVCFGVIWFLYLIPVWGTLSNYQAKQVSLMPPVIPQAQKISSNMAGGLSTNFELWKIEYRVDESLSNVQKYYEKVLIDYCKSPLSRRNEDIKTEIACYKEPCKAETSFQYTETFILKLEPLSTTQTKITTYYSRFSNACDPDTDPFKYRSEL